MDIVSAGIGALIALGAAYATSRYERSLRRRDAVDRLSLHLAALAIRLRRAVLWQFVAMPEVPWIQPALEEQSGILSELDALLAELEHIGGPTWRGVLAARESLWSNIVTLKRWQVSWQGQEPLTSQLGPVDASHHDLWGASQLLTAAVADLRDKHIREHAQALGAEIMRLREDARRGILPGVEAIQALTEEARELWVRTGSGS